MFNKERPVDQKDWRQFQFSYYLFSLNVAHVNYEDVRWYIRSFSTETKPLNRALDIQMRKWNSLLFDFPISKRGSDPRRLEAKRQVSALTAADSMRKESAFFRTKHKNKWTTVVS